MLFPQCLNICQEIWQKVAVLPAKAVKKTTTKKSTANKSAKVLKMDAEVSEVERSVMVAAEVCDRISIDGDAEKIMSVARLGALFG